MSDDAMGGALAGPARLAALAETGLMGTASRETLDRFARLGRNAIGTAVAAVSLIDEGCQFFSSAEGLPDPAARTLPLSHSFCKYVVAEEAEFSFGDALEHPTMRHNLAVRDLAVRAYAGFPIRTHDGHVLGSFCAIDDQPREWRDRDFAILRDLATSVSAEVDLIRRARRAEASEGRLAKANVALIQQSDAGLDADGVLHDLGTPLNVLSLGLEHLETHEALTGFGELRTLLTVMRRSTRHAHAVLARGRGRAADHRGDAELLDVAALLREVCEEQRTGAAVAIECPLAEPLTSPSLSAPDATDLRRCLENLLSNAKRFARSRIVARAQLEGDLVTIHVDDDGEGLPSDAHEAVWEPRTRFHGDRSQTGLGLAVVRELVEALGGQVAATTAELGGARFTLRFPT